MNSKTRQLGSSLQMALVTAALAATLGAACIAANSAAAAVRFNSNGGTSCKASFGDGAKLFYFSSLFAENTSASGQFLTCAIAEMNPLSSRSADNIGMALTNTTGATVTFTCALSAGNGEFGGAVNTAVYVVDVSANNSAELVSTSGTSPALPLRSSAFSPYELNCIVPAGGRVGRLTTSFPESF